MAIVLCYDTGVIKCEVKCMTHTFKGGVHPNYMKAPEIPMTVMTPPPQVVIPMIQHIGAPNKPLVQKGDYVTMGQKIGGCAREQSFCISDRCLWPWPRA